MELEIFTIIFQSLKKLNIRKMCERGNLMVSSKAV